MATLASLADRVRRKLGLSTGSHSIVCDFSEGAANNYLEIDGIRLICETSTGNMANQASINLTTDDNTTAANLNTTIAAVFAGHPSISASVSTATVTVVGARTISTDDTALFAITESASQDEPPLTSDIDQWLLDGQLDLLSKLNDGAIKTAANSGGSAIFVATTIANGSDAITELAKPSPVLRIIDVSYQTMVSGDGYKRAERVPYDLLLDIQDGTSSFYKTYSATPVNNRFYSIVGNKLVLSQATGNNIKYTAVIIPDETRTNACDLPVTMHTMLVDYACAQALYQLGKDAEAQATMARYMQDIQVMNMRETPVSEPSHEQLP